MSDLNLIALTFDNPDGATKTLATVVTAKQKNLQIPLVEVADAAVATRNEKGKIKIRQTLESALKGSRVVGGGGSGVC